MGGKFEKFLGLSGGRLLQKKRRFGFGDCVTKSVCYESTLEISNDSGYLQEKNCLHSLGQACGAIQPHACGDYGHRKGRVAMARILKIHGVDNREVESTVRKAYAADKDAWDAMCGMHKPFATVLDLIDAKMALLKTEATKEVGNRRSALQVLRMRHYFDYCKNDVIQDVTEEELDAFIEARG